MSRSNYDKPFYVDVGTSIVAIRCASNHDIIMRYAIVVPQHTLKLAEDACDRMNKEAEIGRPRRNCDVGAPEEQAKRLSEWCSGRHCVNCQFKGGWPDECKLRWAQMPYEEGGAK